MYNCNNNSIFLTHIKSFKKNDSEHLKYLIYKNLASLSIDINDLNLDSKTKLSFNKFDNLNKNIKKNINKINKYQDLDKIKDDIFLNILEKTNLETFDNYQNQETKETFFFIKVDFDWLQFLNYEIKLLVLTQLSEKLNNIEFPENSNHFIYSQTNFNLDIISTHNRLNLDYYILPNRKEYLDFLNYFLKENDNYFKPYNKLYNNKKNVFETYYLFKQQKFITNYLNDNTPYRGLLLYHGLGSGKSGASISTAEGFKEKKVIVMTPSSLQLNYKTEIKSFGKISYRTNYFWCFTPLDLENDDYKKILISKGISKELLETNKGIIIKKKTKINGKNYKHGIWMIDISKKPNYNELTDIEKKEINKTIDILTEHKYIFINYNSGRAFFKNIFNRLCSKEELDIIDKEILTDEEKNTVKGIRNENNFNYYKDKILNYIYNPNIVDKKIDNPLDNKILVIDEIHNLISMMTKSSNLNAPLFYELIMRAKNLNIICLSGTPFINTPFELMILFNLIRGNIVSYKLNLVCEEDYDKLNLENIVNKIRYLDRVEIIEVKPNNFNLVVTRLPKNFVRKYIDDDYNNKWDGKIIKTTKLNNFLNNEEFFTKIEEDLLNYNIKLSNRISINNHATFMPDLLLPKNVNNQAKYKFIRTNAKQVEIAREEFFNLYVDESNKIKEKMSFYLRTMGLISFFCETTETISKNFKYEKDELFLEDIPKFPSVFYENPIEIDLSIYQLLNYVKKREKEINELKNNPLDNKKFEVPRSFRTNTRQISNFGFPPNLKRLNNKNEVNIEKLSRNNLVSRNLLENPEDFNEFSLTELSPKFEKIINNLLISPGISICYSQYRSVEGLEILGRCLSELGYDKYEDNLKDIENYEYKLNDLCRIKLGENIYITSKITFIEEDKVKFEDINKDIENNLETLKRDWKLDKKLNRTDLIKLLQKHLDENMYENILNETLNEFLFDINDINKCRFSFWDTSKSKSQFLELFNSTKNSYGQYVQLLFITQSGAEGLNLKNVRQVHITEPYWNRVRIDQVIGRARRVGSHLNLPPEQHNVIVYEYHTIFPNIEKKNLIKDKNIEKNVEEYINSDNNLSESNKIGKYIDLSDFLIRLKKVVETDNNISTDKSLYNLSLKKKGLSESFLQLVKNIAIDCLSNFKENDQANSLQKDSKEIVCFNSKEKEQKHKAILSRSDYSYELNDNSNELKESIKESMNIYLVESIKQFKLPLKYFALQNRNKNYFHKDFKFWINPTFNSNNIILCKSNKNIINYYQYMGLDPLYNSFVNPLLRKGEQITENLIIGKYEGDDNDKFNGKMIKLNLGDSITMKKAYTIYLYKLQQFINGLKLPDINQDKIDVINSNDFSNWLYQCRKQIRNNFKIKFQYNGKIIEKKYLDFVSKSFKEALKKPIVKDIYLETYLLFSYEQLRRMYK